MKYQSIGWLIIVCVCAVTSLMGHAQVVRLYTTQQGLKTNNCHSVDLDSRGFVWVSGTDALGVFDGTRFQYLPTKGADGKQLFQTATRVKEAGNDRFWVCTSHGLFLLNARTMEFKRIYMEGQEDSIYGYTTNNVIDYPKKDYKLVTTDGFNTFLLNAKTLKVDDVLSEKLNSALRESFVIQPVIDKRGRLWAIGRTTQLMCIDLDSFTSIPVNYTPGAAAIAKGSTFTRLLETEEGLLIGTNHGLLIYNSKENLVKESDAYTGDLYISAILRTHDHRILVGTDGRGIWEYKKTGGVSSFTSLYDKAPDFDISYGKVMDMTEDKKGNVVAAFLQKGLVVIPPQNDCFHYHPISPQGNGSNATCITSMAIDSKENYWVATDGCGVFTTDGMRLATAHPINDGLRCMLVQDVKIDKHGTVWAGTYGGGVQWLENGKWTNRGLEGISQELVMTLSYNSEEDKLLVGTNGHGIICVDVVNRTFSRLTFPFSYNQWISALLQDSQGTLWVGSSTGVFSYNASNGKHEEISLNGNRISNASAIQQDGNDILIASEEGLVIYHLKTKKQELINEGFDCRAISAITTTDRHIWLATRVNIVSVDKRTREVRSYSSFSGYDVGEFHRNSYVKPGHGYILFGGNNGIICFTPKLISNRPTKVEPVYFTRFATPLGTEEMDASIYYAKEISLTHDNATFSIEFSSVELGDPERIHYEYILEGLEKQWHKDVSAPNARYSALPPGTYTFRVRAYIEDNPNEFTENAIVIRVSPPWYATVWAYLIYTLIVLALAYFVYQQIQLRKQQKEQLRKTDEQNRIKEEKLNLFTSITHELRSPLTMIESPLKQLMTEDTNPEHQSLYAVMRHNCDRLLGIVKQITDIRKIDSGQMIMHLREHDYVAYANHVFAQFEGVASVKEITFVKEHAEEELPMMMDETHFEKIITNLLSNAFKFTPQGGKVIAKSCIENNQVVLTFYNSGPQFSQEDQRHLWERFYQGSAGEDTNGSGIGLNLVHELVRLHHGTIEARNVNPVGVEFVLHFPYYNGQTTIDPANGLATLLLVDDDTELSDFMVSQLNKDYNVITAFSGNSAWKKVQSQRPDVVVTDYRLPEANGMELCQRIKSNPETCNIPVILLTGEGDEALQLQSLNVQVDHYMEKPVNIVLLRSAISQAISVRETLRTKARRAETVGEVPLPVVENANEKFFVRVNEIIKKHIEESDFTIQQLSEEVGISRVHLNRKMKERYGVSPNNFVRLFRLKQAAYLLAYNKVNISEVAYAVGFSSHSYFTCSFHDCFGMSPKEFVNYYSDEENKVALKKLLDIGEDDSSPIPLTSGEKEGE